MAMANNVFSVSIAKNPSIGAFLQTSLKKNCHGLSCGLLKAIPFVSLNTSLTIMKENCVILLIARLILIQTSHVNAIHSINISSLMERFFFKEKALLP